MLMLEKIFWLISNDNVEAVVTEKASGKGRGRDIEWIEVERFSDKSVYEMNVI